VRALVAMSGGVDSSVAAALMVEQGWDVVGVTLKQWEGAGGSLPTAGCCTVADAEDARSVAGRLDVPYYVLDYVDAFTSAVVDPFGEAYMAGRTPNPCIECNRRVRFKALLERTAALECDVLVTGHHARVRRDGAGFHLLRATDTAKDQSYVLHMLGQRDLERIRFPVGEMTKAQVRDEAARLGLRTATKPDSQDLCFVGKGDYRTFLRTRLPEAARPGVIVTGAGDVVGHHEGTVDYTIGQRRGLGAAGGEPRYVIEIRPADATVVVGSRRDLLAGGCRVEGVSFVAGHAPATDRVGVKIRYRSDPAPARLAEGGDGTWEVRFAAPQTAVTPGQAAVFYDGDEVLGGGTIGGTLAAA
jgi:tRNA-specific 2-thiouridylase